MALVPPLGERLVNRKGFGMNVSVVEGRDGARRNLRAVSGADTSVGEGEYRGLVPVARAMRSTSEVGLRVPGMMLHPAGGWVCPPDWPGKPWKF